LGKAALRAKNCRFLSENLEVSPLAKCKKSAVQHSLYFALRANELPAHGAKGGLHTYKTVVCHGAKIAISRMERPLCRGSDLF